MAKKNNKSSNKLIYILVGVVIVLVGFILVGKSMGWVGGPKQMEVQTAKAKKTTIVEKVSASGMVQPETEVKMSPDVAGEIIALEIEEGDSVIQGQLLVKIRPDNWITALERAKASLNQQKANLASAKAAKARSEATLIRAKADYERQKQLWDQKVISQADWQLAEQNYLIAKSDIESATQSVKAAVYVVRSSEATVSEAKENVRLTSVFAPVSGIVSKLIVEKGERVVGTQQMAGTEMLRIADLNKMEVRVDVNENDIIRVGLGDTAIIDVDSYAHLDKKFTGLVTSIANTANDKVSSDAVTEFEVKIRILNESYKDLIKEGNKFPFRPGMTASVEIITDRKSGILSVPLASVTTRNPKELEERGRRKKGEGSEEDEEGKKEDKEGEDKEVVFVNVDGMAVLKEVKTGISDYDNIEILKGLKEGDEVITGPFLAVSKKLKGEEHIRAENEDEKDKEEKKED